jgi:hypothetical protein
VRATNLSAPWLLVPFLAGATQAERGRAGWLGLAAAFAALAGYFGMMWSPFEGVDLVHAQQTTVVGGHVHVTVIAYRPAQIARHILHLLGSQAPWMVAGIATGPIFGLLGREWRSRHTWRSALAIGGAFCLEPVAVVAFHAVFFGIPTLGGFGAAYRFDAAAAAEVGFGLLLLIGAAYAITRQPGPRPH